METYKIDNALRISKAGENYDYFQLQLKDSLGESLATEVRVSTKMLTNLLKQKEVNVGVLTNLERQMLIDSASLKATITYKEKGDEFTASEFTMVPGKTAKDPWVNAVKGEKYKVQETGYWIDYDAPIALDFDLALARQLEREYMAYERAQKQLSGTAV